MFENTFYLELKNELQVVIRTNWWCCYTRVWFWGRPTILKCVLHWHGSSMVRKHLLHEWLIGFQDGNTYNFITISSQSMIKNCITYDLKMISYNVATSIWSFPIVWCNKPNVPWFATSLLLENEGMIYKQKPVRFNDVFIESMILNKFHDLKYSFPKTKVLWL